MLRRISSPVSVQMNSLLSNSSTGSDSEDEGQRPSHTATASSLRRSLRKRVVMRKPSELYFACSSEDGLEDSADSNDEVEWKYVSTNTADGQQRRGLFIDRVEVFASGKSINTKKPPTLSTLSDPSKATTTIIIDRLNAFRILAEASRKQVQTNILVKEKKKNRQTNSGRNSQGSQLENSKVKSENMPPIGRMLGGGFGHAIGGGERPTQRSGSFGNRRGRDEQHQAPASAASESEFDLTESSSEEISEPESEEISEPESEEDAPYTGSEKENRASKSRQKAKSRQRPTQQRKPKARTGAVAENKVDAPIGGRQKFWNPPTDSDLPPLYKITDIFTDIVTRTPELQDLAKHLNGRKLRLATMCSGTESPLLALNMITHAMKEQFDVSFEIDHLFSCEIVPFKQAYIERNFKPKLLFRDIRELGNDEATTCYGARVPVPGDCDLLVAGTSCVDYSGLNNSKKSITAGGESGATFFSMMKWVNKHRPRIVIVENVSSAPWPRMTAEFRNAGYKSEFCRFDTKDYYIPHTRNRGYLIAIKSDSSKVTDQWIKKVQSMKRPASCTFESFLLDRDDPRAYEAFQRLAESNDRNNPPWDACQIRHERERHKYQLGSHRPLLGGQDGAKMTPPSNFHVSWVAKQPDRVADAIEIMYLRNALGNVDSCYKTQMWNLSQNVDRNIEGSRSGISSCLTPTGIPFVTTRGGPVLGVEALSLQGLPVEQLLLTRETDSQLMDLAGNAMSSTVVGTCIIAGLLSGIDSLPKGESTAMVGDDEISEDVANHIIGAEGLTPSPLDLVTIRSFNLLELLEQARRSASLCECEGRTNLVPAKIFRCKDCDSVVCANCIGNPEHNYEVRLLDNSDRILPVEFENKLKAALPMVLRISGVDEATLRSARAEWKAEHETSEEIRRTWISWLYGATKAFESELRFRTLKRGRQWTACYEAPCARLELSLDPALPEWRLFYIVPLLEPAKSPLRALFARPVARMRIGQLLDNDNLVSGSWDVCLPVTVNIDLHIKGHGPQIPSWKNSLGLEMYNEEMVWSKLEITMPDTEKAAFFDEQLQGMWSLLPKCGTACRALHRKDNDTQGSKPLFLFYDPTKASDPGLDSFVVSTDCRRYRFPELRLTIAQMEPSWSPSNSDGVEKVICSSNGLWTRLTCAKFDLSVRGNEQSMTAFAGPEKISAQHHTCREAPVFFACQAINSNVSKLFSSDWAEVEPTQEREVFASLSWLTERTKSMAPSSDWAEVPQESLGTHDCQTCAPTPPPLRWRETAPNKYVPVEDPEKAAPYERSLKSRPSPWMSQVRLVNDRLLELQIGLNLTTLCHRAISALSGPAKQVVWKIETNYVPPVDLNLESFQLHSNKDDKPAQQPPNFRLSLRKEQLRSLSWMVEQESGSISPFQEEEVIEAVHEHMLWRVAVKAVRENHIRGGILADEVGYGKTATTLGLFDHQQGQYQTPPDSKGRIPVKATLVIVPAHLTNQWRAEVSKFLGDRKYKVLVIKTVGDLNKLSIKNIMDADLIIMSSSCFKTNTYLENLAALAGSVDVPNCIGRRYDHWISETLAKLVNQTQRLQAEGATAVLTAIRSSRNQPSKDEVVSEESKRLRGAEFMAAISAKRASNASTKSRKRKGLDDDESDDDSVPLQRAKPKARRDNDLWNLGMKVVRDDWTQMRSPPIEMFYFNRVVVDEFTYNFDDPKIQTSIVKLESTYKWVLSGTPPLADFADVKNIAQYLGINLGIHHDSKYRKLGTASTDRSLVEAFQFFEDKKTPTWHENRHQVAQRFLDKFMRQNTPEVAEIKCEEHLIPFNLPAAEMAIYLELDHHLASIGVFSRRVHKKAGSDKIDRLHEVIGESFSAEEALMKRCSHFDLLKMSIDDRNGKTTNACEAVFKRRQKQLEDNKKEIFQELSKLYHMRDEYLRISEVYDDVPNLEPLNAFLARQREAIHDPEISPIYHDIIRKAEDPQRRAKYNDDSVKEETPDTPRPKKKARVVKDGDEEDDDGDRQMRDVIREDDGNTRDQVFELFEKIKRNHSHQLQLSKELLARCRSLRYFECIKDLQAPNATKMIVQCPNCNKATPFEQLAMTSTCGHKGCEECVRLCAAEKKACVAEKDGCSSIPRETDVVVLKDLRLDDQVSSQKAARTMPYGRKMHEVVDLIKNKIPDDEKVVLFVQFPDLLEKVEGVLRQSGISTQRLKGSKSQTARLLDEFQINTGRVGYRILLLEPLTESASGANITNANHVIFLSPLLTPTSDIYTASETQAIGRVRRFGQKKTVHVHRFIALDTIDITTYKERTGKTVS